MLVDKEKIRAQFLQDFAGQINKSAKIFCALVTNKIFTGALERALQEVVSFITCWVQSVKLYPIGDNTKNVQTGTQLLISRDFLSYIEETNEDILKRKLRAIFYRNGDSLWGGARNIKNVFKSYFDMDRIWVAENTREYSKGSASNLLKDGDFAGTDNWGSNTGYLCTDARFSGTTGARLAAGTAISQIITLEQGTYFLHWMTRGHITATVTSENDASDTVSAEYNSEGWQARQLRVKVAQHGNYIVQFTGGDRVGDGNEYNDLDYVRLFEKELYPTFTVIVQKEGNTNPDNAKITMADAKEVPMNKRDWLDDLGNPILDDLGKTIQLLDGFGHRLEVGGTPIPNAADYHYYSSWGEAGDDASKSIQGASFYPDNDLGYSEELFTDLLDCVRPVGVRGFIEFVEKGLV